jgi:hypothetical protein
VLVVEVQLEGMEGLAFQVLLQTFLLFLEEVVAVTATTLAVAEQAVYQPCLLKF